jgi:hypothetical protein
LDISLQFDNIRENDIGSASGGPLDSFYGSMVATWMTWKQGIFCRKVSDFNAIRMPINELLTYVFWTAHSAPLFFVAQVQSRATKESRTRAAREPYNSAVQGHARPH